VNFNLQRLEGIASNLVKHSVAPKTLKVYTQSYRTYQRLMSQIQRPERPTSSTLMWDNLLLFIAGLNKLGLASSSATTYVAGVRHFLRTELSTVDQRQVSAALKGYLRLAQSPLNQKRPITTGQLALMEQKLQPLLREMEEVWAVIVIGVFGLFRLGEMVPDRPSDFCKMRHPMICDLSWTSNSVGIRLKVTKTDQGARLRQTVSLQCSCPVGFKPCPVCLLRSVSAGNPPPGRSLFVRKGLPVCRPLVIEKIKAWTAGIGLPGSEFSGHSLRRGGATSALIVGLTETETKKLGRWKGDTYLAYQAPPDRVLAALSGKLALAGSIIGD